MKLLSLRESADPFLKTPRYEALYIRDKWVKGGHREVPKATQERPRAPQEHPESTQRAPKSDERAPPRAAKSIPKWLVGASGRVPRTGSPKKTPRAGKSIPNGIQKCSHFGSENVINNGSKNGAQKSWILRARSLKNMAPA